ncbi:hypothetical protein GCM10025768_24860 [Microbacterium pseudoresistens]|uniref:Uncharacterized protein n=1 Tax=Microbacterium pseudoresistens TaxID=640634 RepID=A0A7Y9EWL6_9MICO|nr:hypothetical protein [Microbacterium pseudoresistens]NYD55305.1 hypothetical protein [Microbacterium pseudoresistens]
MSTPDRPEAAPLTRKQLREARLTGATNVVTPEQVQANLRERNRDVSASRGTPVIEAPIVEAPVAETPAADAPAPYTPDRYAPAAEAPASAAQPDPVADAAPRLTRRQAREQERIRTGSLPVFGARAADETPAEAAAPIALPEAQSPVVPDAPQAPAPISPTDGTATPESVASQALDGSAGGSRVRDGFGESLIRDDERNRPLTPSFDSLLSTDSSGSQSRANALIFQQSPGVPSLSGPVASTGEVLVTGSYELPARLGSHGHGRGTDGKEVDAVLIDGELPASSSPTPIAASSAISTIKPAGEVIRPPEPEKGNKLMLALTITAGVLAAALVGALIIAMTTGVFS